MFFLFSALQVGLAGWTFAGPPVVGKWAAGVFTMIDQFKAGGGTDLTPSGCICSSAPLCFAHLKSHAVSCLLF